jgi:hypothetical protein
LCLIPCTGKLDRWFTFDWLTSYTDYNPTLNCVGSPGASQVRTCETERVTSSYSGKRNDYSILFRTDGVLLEVRNQKERSYAWILMLQLVTLKPGAVAIPEAQPMQSFSCSAVFQHILAAGVDSHVPTCLLLADCAHDIIGHALKLILTSKFPPLEDDSLSIL